MRVDNTITLVVENIGKGKKFEKAALPCPSLTDDVNVARAVATKEPELVVYTAEVSKSKSGDVFVFGGSTSEHWELCGWFSGFREGPDDVWSFDRSVGEMINRGELGDIKNETVIGKLAEFVAVEDAGIESATEGFEAV